MENLTRLYLFIAVLFVVGITILFYYNKNLQKNAKAKREFIASLKEQYDAALRSGNKAAALEKGRLYYQAVRGGNLTIYDEQALTNDLSTIQNN